jgi:1-deoxy-D-xylulose-5-phosphate reductoisomerase
LGFGHWDLEIAFTEIPVRKKVCILGSTGSIGRATLEVLAAQEDRFQVYGLACRESVELLNTQVARFKPSYVCVYDAASVSGAEAGNGRLLTGMEGMKHMIAGDADIVVNALPGSIGLEPTLETLRHGKVLALANKESLVMAGRLISRILAAGTGGRLIPVDSEHSALHQLLKTVDQEEVENIVITASGGPFRDYPKETLADVTLEEALNHPTWKMGNKITLDSATLMNKGLEVIEARWLFNVEAKKIRVLIHPESIVHGIVELCDGSFLAYLAAPDMKVPISYALNEERRSPLPFGKLRLEETSKLTFRSPDIDRFPCLRLAYEALSNGDSAMVVLNTANEAASQAFIDGRIRFTDIPAVIEEALLRHPQQQVIETLAAIGEVRRWTEKFTEERLRKTYDY